MKKKYNARGLSHVGEPENAGGDGMFFLCFNISDEVLRELLTDCY